MLIKWQNIYLTHLITIMKLRSGKIINVQKLPIPLNNVLQKELSDFKNLFSSFKEHV
jgi:predicted  nucleic acid-binding Zn ribbon protein